MTYVPRPLDLSKAKLHAKLGSLVEALSRHTHDVWASERLMQGWTWGPVRNDAAKEHPCLVPYEELPEAEKDMDRALVRGVLRAVVALGYELRPAKRTASKARRPAKRTGDAGPRRTSTRRSR